MEIFAAVGRHRLRRHRTALLAGLVSTALLGTTAAFTLGGMSATIDNNNSTFSSGTITAPIVLEETNGTVTCKSTDTGGNTNSSCGINVLNGALDQEPGGTPLTTTITLRSTGTGTPTTATLTTGACSAGAASDAGGNQGADTAGFCGKVDVTIANTTSGATDQCVYPAQAAACPSLSSTYTLATLANTSFSTSPLSVPVSGSPATYVVSVQLDSSASNADQSLAATVPFSWSIS